MGNPALPFIDLLLPMAGLNVRDSRRPRASGLLLVAIAFVGLVWVRPLAFTGTKVPKVSVTATAWQKFDALARQRGCTAREAVESSTPPKLATRKMSLPGSQKPQAWKRR